jgi:hypothetical protein
MTSKSPFLLALMVLVCLGGLAAGAWWLFSDGPVTQAALAPPPAPRAEVRPEADGGSERAEVELAEPRAASDTVPIETSVVYPLEIQLELGRPERLIAPEGAAAVGSAATATLKGAIYGGDDSGVRAEVRFEHGPNEGRVLTCDGSGEFGASDLYPGLAIVRVEGPGLLGSRREVLLRQERETTLVIGYSRAARVSGEVLDREGAPIAGARVSFDGQEARTGEDGTFFYTQVAGGENIVVTVEKEGLRAVYERARVTSGTTIEPGTLKYVLVPGASLEIAVPERIGAEEEATVLILPPMGKQRDFPWFLVNPVRVWPGGSVRVDGLPTGRIDVRLFHAGAVAKPALAVANLRFDDLERIEIHLEAAPLVTGVVRQGGRPVEDARVVLEAADRVAATVGAVDEAYGFVESEVMPTLPPAQQVAFTDEQGRFTFSAWEGASQSRYLTATGPDGRTWAGKHLSAGESQVDLALAQWQPDDSTVRIRLDGRIQPLPVKVTVDGQPRDEFVLPVDRDLVVEGLARGEWSLFARWNTEWLERDKQFTLAGEAEFELELPEGAIEGQSEEIRQRAGKR